MDLINDIARLVLVVYALYVGARVLRSIDDQKRHHDAQMAMLDILVARKAGDYRR